MRQWSVIVEIKPIYREAFLEPYVCEQFLLSFKDGSFVLESDQFENCSGYPEVEGEATKMIELLNGIFAVKLGMNRPIEFSAVTRRNEFGGKEIVICLNDTVSIRDSLSITVINREGKIVHTYNSDRIDLNELLKKAMNETSLQKIFRIISHEGWKFESMTKVLEVLQSAPGGHKIGKRSGIISKNKIAFLERTAQLYRHADAKNPPEFPMSLDEAKAIIITLINEYIDKVENELS